jgi:hypothetical protein
MVAPPFIGDILALAMYLLCWSNVVAADPFPGFSHDVDALSGIESMAAQHGEGMTEDARLLHWSFVVGFNLQYVVDFINSRKGKP